MKLVYAVFRARRDAEKALDDVYSDATLDSDGEGLDTHSLGTAAIHERRLTNRALPRTATFSRRAALVGGVSVAVVVGLLASLLMAGGFTAAGGPEAIVGFNAIGLVGLILSAGLFGAFAGGIAGAAGNRTVTRRLDRQLSSGRALLTLETREPHAGTLARALDQRGALQAGVV